jgi:hypothetical protein
MGVTTFGMALPPPATITPLDTTSGLSSVIGGASPLSPELQAIRSSLVSWGGDGLTIVKLIDGGASLPQIRDALVNLRMTTTHPDNTQFLTPIVTAAQAALTASNAAQGLPPPPSLPDWPGHQNTWTAALDVGLPILGALAPLTGGLTGLIGAGLAGLGAAAGSGLSSYIQDEEVTPSLISAGISGLGAGLGSYYGPALAGSLGFGPAGSSGATSLAELQLLARAGVQLTQAEIQTLAQAGISATGSSLGAVAPAAVAELQFLARAGAQLTQAEIQTLAEAGIDATGAALSGTVPIALGGNAATGAAPAGTAASGAVPTEEILVRGALLPQVASTAAATIGAVAGDAAGATGSAAATAGPPPNSYTAEFTDERGVTDTWSYDRNTSEWTNLTNNPLPAAAGNVGSGTSSVVGGTLTEDVNIAVPKLVAPAVGGTLGVVPAAGPAALGSTIGAAAGAAGASAAAPAVVAAINPQTGQPQYVTNTYNTTNNPPPTPPPKAAMTPAQIASLIAGITSLFGGAAGSQGSAGAGVMPAGFSTATSARPVFSAQLPPPSLLATGSAAGPRDVARTEDEWNNYGRGPEQSFYNNVPPRPSGVVGAARGGALNDLMRGRRDGRSDHVPAMLSDGEYVVDAETVALLGNGSNKAGAKQLDRFRVALRKHKGRKLVKGKFSVRAKAPSRYMVQETR